MIVPIHFVHRFAQAVFAKEVLIFGLVVAPINVTLFDDTMGTWHNTTVILTAVSQSTYFGSLLTHIPLDGSVHTSRVHLVLPVLSMSSLSAVDAVLLVGTAPALALISTTRPFTSSTVMPATLMMSSAETYARTSGGVARNITAVSAITQSVSLETTGMSSPTTSVLASSSAATFLVVGVIGGFIGVVVVLLVVVGVIIALFVQRGRVVRGASAGVVIENASAEIVVALPSKYSSVDELPDEPPDARYDEFLDQRGLDVMNCDALTVAQVNIVPRPPYEEMMPSREKSSVGGRCVDR
jgi:hypothetical protein